MSNYENTYFIDEQTRAAAFELAHCKTARNLLWGSEWWSLSTLQGKARRYGGSYARARDNFLARLEAAGLQPVTLYVGPQHRRIVIL